MKNSINESIPITALVWFLIVLGTGLFAGCAEGYLDGFGEGFDKCVQVYERVEAFKEADNGCKNRYGYA